MKINLKIANLLFNPVIFIASSIGIPKNDFPRIFERFYRVDNSRDRGTGGYGLGLSIAKAIVEEHKGKIYAESVVREYTSFIVELPVYFEKQKLINDLKIGN